MFRRKKKTDDTSVPPPSPETAPASEEAAVESPTEPVIAIETVTAESSIVKPSVSAPAKAAASRARGNRVQKVGIVSSDKMQKTVVVRVDRLVLHQKYRRYVRRTTKFKAHDDLGSGVGDRVRIVETRPLSAQKRWRVVEILQKAAK